MGHAARRRGDGEAAGRGTCGLEATLARAEALAGEFERRVGDVEFVPRGIAASEAFFIYATLAGSSPRQIVESGRAQGQSTVLLARCFPDVSIVSIERDPDHPDAARAVERLRGLSNVACLFGDARRLLPELVLPGDAVIVDGPKRFRALKLVFDVLRRARPSVVFIHDCARGTGFRRFLETHVPWAFYSDDHRFVQRYCYLDRYEDPEVIRRWSAPSHRPGDASYAGTFACIPCRPGVPGPAMAVRLRLARWRANVAESTRRRAAAAARVLAPARRAADG